MFNFSRLIFLGALLMFCGTTIFDDDAPQWMRQAAQQNVPAYDKEVNAVVLLNEQLVSLDSDGKLVTTENYAVKILSREGRKNAVAAAYYLVSSGKVRDINGWLIRSDGTVKTYDKKSVVDVISDNDDVYNEGRVKVINAADDVDANSVFGYTIVSEDKPLYFQDKWFSQDRNPTLVARYGLNLPSGWKASSVTFNHAEVAPQVNGSNYTWEFRNLPPVKAEPMSPSVVNLIPWLAVTYSPDSNSQNASKAFANWTDVSRWTSAMYDTQVVVDDNVANKARELTANAQTELDKIRAVANYVQNLQYISIDIDVGHGNGIRPRPSNLVLSRGYGDCKDKANLMRALLKALKIEAYPIAIYSGDSTFVRQEWVSPGQFNHCIIAVKVSDATQAATIIEHPKLGRLLIFDATDPYTAVGDLPDHEQGSLALIIAGENGGLSRMPVTPANFNAWNRQIDINLTPEGNISGSIKEKATGQQSTYARGEFRSMSLPDFNKVIESWLTRGATSAKLIKLTPKDRQADAGFDLDVEFSAANYGQLMQNRLLVFKPAIVNRANSIYLTEPKRNNPVMLGSTSFSEVTTFTLPQGFAVDEMPDAVNLETDFGKYKTSYEVKEGKLVFSRSLIMNRSVVPIERYASVKDFYTKILAAEQSPVVLLKK